MKIIFLSLGAGNLFDKDNNEDKRVLLEKMVIDDQYAYSTANYRLGGKIYKSPFVAEALIDQYKPNYVLLVGTVKSAWSNFYAKFYDDHNKADNILRLYDQEQNNGLSESKNSDKLLEFEENIKEIIPSVLNYNGMEIQIDIKLLAYGIDQKELQLNYFELADKWNEIINSIPDQDVDIAFDITHSFRSMPLYNISLLNYLLHTSKKNITLSHVFYGNLDAARENNDVAEVLDLSSITDVFRLTNGVSEFSSAGNAAIIMNEVAEEDPAMASCLERFDWAIQTNRLFMIIESIKELNDELVKRDRTSRFFATYEMLSSVLEQSFPSYDELCNLDDLDNHITAYANVQRLIGLWHLEHGRCGQALVNADECLRSYVTSIYYKARGETITKKLVFDEGHRTTAFGGLLRNNREKNYVRYKEQYSDFAECLIKLHKLQKANHDDRNVFAHFLWSADKKRMQEDDFDYRRVKKEISEFYDELNRFEWLILADTDRVLEYIRKVCNFKNLNSNNSASKTESTLVIHLFTPLKLSKKGNSLWGILEDNTPAMIRLTKGRKQSDYPAGTKVYIESEGPQDSKIVEAVKE